MHLSRRELLWGSLGAIGLSALEGFSFAGRSQTTSFPLYSPDVPSSDPNFPYFSKYSLSGLMAVLARTTHPDEQHFAAGALAIKGSARGFRDLFLHEGRLATFNGNVHIEDISDHLKTPFLCTRTSPAYQLFMQDIPRDMRDRVIKETEWLCIHPDVISARDSPQFLTGGVPVGAHGMLVESQALQIAQDRVLLSAFIVHEAEHLATRGLPLLRTELAAYSKHEKVLYRAVHDGVEGLADRLSYIRMVMQTAHYLSDERFSGAFDSVYPHDMVLGEHLVDAQVPLKTLVTYRFPDTGDRLMDMVLGEACKDALAARKPRDPSENKTASEQQGSSGKKPDAPERIQDPGYNAPLVVRV